MHMVAASGELWQNLRFSTWAKYNRNSNTAADETICGNEKFKHTFLDDLWIIWRSVGSLAKYHIAWQVNLATFQTRIDYFWRWNFHRAVCLIQFISIDVGCSTAAANSPSRGRIFSCFPMSISVLGNNSPRNYTLGSQSKKSWRNFSPSHGVPKVRR